jgi:hypothetical protein
MSEQPPVQQPDQPIGQPSSPPTQVMSAQSAPPAGPPAGPPVVPVSGPAPTPSGWQRATSTRGARWGLGIAAVGLVCLMILGIGIAGIAISRNHDRVGFMGDRQAGYFRGQADRGSGPGLNNGRGFGNGPQLPNGAQPPNGTPRVQGGRAQGLGGLGNLLGGAVQHGDVTTTVNGAAQALVFQRGEVTAVSGTSITLKSSDGFVGTYGRDASTKANKAAPVKGGQAFVLARTSDKVALRILAMPAAVGSAPVN